MKNEELREKVKNLRWKDQKLEFLVETIQRLKKEGVKNVNNVAARILPNRIEAATQKIRTKPEYKQTGKGLDKKNCYIKRVLKTPSRTLMSATLTSKSVTRTPPTLPTVPPTHIQSLVHRRRSLPPVPPIDQAKQLVHQNCIEFH